MISFRALPDKAAKRSPHRWSILVVWLLAGLCSHASAQQQDTVKLMFYNLLNYQDPTTGASGAADTALRNPFYRTVVQNTNPDILVVCEMTGPGAFQSFFNRVMNASGNMYSAGTYVSSPDSERGIFFKSSKFQFVSNTPINTPLRDINMFTLIHIPSGDTLRVFAVHLKAAGGSTNEQARLQEVDSLRKVTNALPTGSNFIVCGDFNIYGSAEPAYQKLLQVQSGNQGHCIDPISLSGTWNNPAYAIHHTQSPRVRAFGGGATGGLDDRFDMILYSTAVQQPGGITAIPSSLRAFGNDGLHYNDSINRPPNNAVSSAVANALHNASDHIPVLMNFTFEYGITQIDPGVDALLLPSSPCPRASAPVSVRVKNNAITTLDFTAHPHTVNLSATNPNGQVQTFSVSIVAGLLSPEADTTIVLFPSYSFSSSGSYQFSANLSYSGSAQDLNTANNTLTVSSFSIAHVSPASIQPSGTIWTCPGDTVIFTASGGSSFMWSQGSAVPAIQVHAAGSFIVTVTDANGCTSVSAPTVIQQQVVAKTDTLLVENMGVVISTTTISTHETSNGFQNSALFMSGTADVRSTTTSSGAYTGASGGANVFITNVSGRFFKVAGINTLGKTEVRLAFGIYKSTASSTGSDLKVQYSLNDTVWIDLPFPSLPVGSATWTFRTCSSFLPAVQNLSIRFINTDILTQYRIDDLLITCKSQAEITSSDGSFLCSSQTKTLTASGSLNYLWNNGATTSSISVSAPGTYSVRGGCLSPVSFTYAPCAFIDFQLKLFIEGYYNGGGLMTSRLSQTGQVQNGLACDSLELKVYGASSPYPLLFESALLFATNGIATVELPAGLSGQSVYICVMGQAILQTWTKVPVYLQPPSVTVDLTVP